MIEFRRIREILGIDAWPFSSATALDNNGDYCSAVGFKLLQNQTAKFELLPFLWQHGQWENNGGEGAGERMWRHGSGHQSY